MAVPSAAIPSTFGLITSGFPVGDRLSPETEDVAEENFVVSDRFSFFRAVPAVTVSASVLEVLAEHLQLGDDFVVLAVVDPDPKI